MIVKVFILVPLFLVIIWCKSGSADEDLIERDWYRNIIKSSVVPPYIEAYKIFKEKIIEKLIHFNQNETLISSESEDNETRIHQFAQQLHCNIRRMNEKLNETVDVSYRTMKNVEAKIIPIQKKIEKQKRRIRDINTKKTKIDISITQVKNQMDITENLIRDKQEDLDRAEDDVKEAERKLERAKLCRSKRFWGWNPISEIKKIGNQIATGVSNAAETIVDGTQHVYSKTEEAVKDIGDDAAHGIQVAGQTVADQVSEHYETVEDGVKEYVIKPICSVFNHEGINNARYIRNEALESLKNARDQLQKYRNQLSNHQNNKRRLELDLTRANNLIDKLNVEIEKLYTNLNLTTTINSELKIAVHHVSILSSRSHVLKEEIKYLIDFNLLIQPLNNVYNELKDNNLLSQAIDDQYVLITEEEVESIQNSLKELMNILPNTPMNTSENELVEDDDVNCDE